MNILKVDDIVFYEFHKCKVIKAFPNNFYDIETCEPTERMIVEQFLSIHYHFLIKPLKPINNDNLYFATATFYDIGKIEPSIYFSIQLKCGWELVLTYIQNNIEYFVFKRTNENLNIQFNRGLLLSKLVFCLGHKDEPKVVETILENLITMITAKSE